MVFHPTKHRILTGNKPESRTFQIGAGAVSASGYPGLISHSNPSSWGFMALLASSGKRWPLYRLNVQRRSALEWLCNTNNTPSYTYLCRVIGRVWSWPWDFMDYFTMSDTIERCTDERSEHQCESFWNFLFIWVSRHSIGPSSCCSSFGGAQILTSMARVNNSKIQCLTPPGIRICSTGLDHKRNGRNYSTHYQSWTQFKLPWNIRGVTSLTTEALSCWTWCPECADSATIAKNIVPSTTCVRTTHQRQKTLYVSRITPCTLRIGWKSFSCWSCQKGRDHHSITEIHSWL